MNGHNQDETPSIEVLLGHITGLQLMIGELVVRLKRKDVFSEKDLNEIFTQSGLRDGKTFAHTSGAQIREADSLQAIRQSKEQVRNLLYPGVSGF